MLARSLGTLPQVLPLFSWSILCSRPSLRLLSLPFLLDTFWAGPPCQKFSPCELILGQHAKLRFLRSWFPGPLVSAQFRPFLFASPLASFLLQEPATATQISAILMLSSLCFAPLAFPQARPLSSLDLPQSCYVRDWPYHPNLPEATSSLLAVTLFGFAAKQSWSHMFFWSFLFLGSPCPRSPSFPFQLLSELRFFL